MMELVTPSLDRLASYREALERGFHPSNVEGEKARTDHLAMIESEPAALVAQFDDPDGLASPFVLADGSLRRRLPGVTRWMWADGAFVGAINLRWQKGASVLPPDVPGHIGYVVAQWARRQGHASAALILMCQEARQRGLEYVELTTEHGNRASQRTIEKAGGRNIGLFDDADLHHHPCSQTLLWRIDL